MSRGLGDVYKRQTTSAPYPCGIFRPQEVIACLSSFRRCSRLGYPQLAIRTGKFGLSALLSFLFHRFSYRLYEFVITDKSTIITYLFSIPWVSGTFPRLHITEAENLHSANPAYTLYPITVAVQLYPIAFG